MMNALQTGQMATVIGLGRANAPLSIKLLSPSQGRGGTAGRNLDVQVIMRL
jgi:hypothetical protein